MILTVASEAIGPIPAQDKHLDIEKYRCMYNVVPILITKVLRYLNLGNSLSMSGCQGRGCRNHNLDPLL